MKNPFSDPGFRLAFLLGAGAGLVLYVRLCQALDSGQAKTSYL